LNRILDAKRDFIEQVAEFIEKTTHTSPQWAESIAASLLSTMMGPERYISDTKGRLNLNVWFLCVGPSGIGQKTTPLKNYMLPILSKATEILDYPLILPSRYSVEKMIGYLDEHNLGIIIRDEFTAMFKEAYSKEYMADSLEFLSELYDGIIHPRATWAHGVNKMKRCYVNLIAASTPYIYKVMKPDFFIQGTGNRIFIVLFDIDNVDKEKLNHETFFRGPIFEDKREQFIDEVAETLARIRHCNVNYIIPDEDASEIWANFEYECRGLAIDRFKKNTFDLHYSYLSRLPEMTLKLSGVYAMSRSWNTLTLSGCPSELMILEMDMKKAVDRGWYHYKQFCKMMSQWRTTPERAFVQSYHEQAMYILDKIELDKKSISWTSLRRLATWDTRTWKEV